MTRGGIPSLHAFLEEIEASLSDIQELFRKDRTIPQLEIDVLNELGQIQSIIDEIEAYYHHCRPDDS